MKASGREAGHKLLPVQPAICQPAFPLSWDATELIEKIQEDPERGPVAVVAVHGLGGLGKSAIALQFAHLGYAAGRFAIAWWIRAESAVTLVEISPTSYRRLAL
jgi:hypothetical protein